MGSELPTLSSRIKTKRSGFALHPVGWLTLASDDVKETYVWRDPEWFGTLHEGDQSRTRSHLGGELRLGHCAAYRWGLRDGQPTQGVMLNLLGLRLNWTEAAGLLPEITGVETEAWRGVHVYGAELGLW